MIGSYGVRTELHPNRQVGRARWAQGIDDDFGGGDFPGQTPTSPPLSEQEGRGVMINPYEADYAPVTGEPGMFYNPDRSMKVGVEYREPPPENLGPLSQFPGSGEGLYSVQPNLTPEQFEQPQQVSNFGPVGDFINRMRPQEST